MTFGLHHFWKQSVEYPNLDPALNYQRCGCGRPLVIEKVHLSRSVDQDALYAYMPILLIKHGVPADVEMLTSTVVALPGDFRIIMEELDVTPSFMLSAVVPMTLS